MSGKRHKRTAERHPVNWQLLSRQVVLVVYDIVAVCAASYLALLIRFEFHPSRVPDYYMTPIIRFMPILLILTIALFYLFRLYN